ncbi:Acid protease [Mycena indigotica]|uniref:Acid protease n=1 Tax=Mycena indigotica TaxID=2126181 RepID=A0A8H6SLM1_9AGAR|nr:Acid protease [Mycena indigotica]KAF7301671.1 Acid protease [Mycena indigotica]
MVLSFILLLLLPVTLAARISVDQVRQPQRSGSVPKLHHVLAASSDTDNNLDINTVHDLIYMANLTVGDFSYPVQLDTGSSDVWIKGPTSPLPNCTDTPLTYNLTYGIGWVFGHIAYGPVRFAGINVASQALLDVSTANNPALAYGAQGLVGLGFTSLSSIDHALNQTGASTGRSLLFNLFQDNPSEPNFIAFSLQRSTDSSATVQGTFSIGEVEPQYASVMDKVPIPTWPISSPKRWNVLLDALLLGDGTIISVNTTVPGAPSNRAVVLLDSGTSYTYAPPEICAAIYGRIPGAYLIDGQWVVPCSAEVDVALQFAGQVLPLHPLDVSPVSIVNNSLCVGSFVPQAVTVGTGEFDWLIGDNVLRSFYSLYDFGDFDASKRMADPYVKLLDLVDPIKASKDFHAARGGNGATNITYNVANSTANTASSVSVSSDVNDTLNKIVMFLPAMLGIMALNAAVLIALIIFGIVFMCRKQRKTKATSRKIRGRSTPLQIDPRNSYVAGADPQPHAYAPVSMAVTEDLEGARPMSAHARDSFAGVPLMDRAPVSMAISEDEMFIPPSPTARPFKSSGLRPKEPENRPDSTVYQRQPSIAVSDDQPYAPPSPGFRNFDGQQGDRPKSAVYQRQPSEDSLAAPARSFDERPRSVGYQRSPSEEDSVFVAEPTQAAPDYIVLPPPHRQAPPPPPSRQAPQAPQRTIPQPPPEDSPPLSSSPEPILPPQRRASQNSVHGQNDQYIVPQPMSRNSTYSTHLVDDQFPPAQPRQMTPQPRRDSSYSVRLTDNQFSPGTSSPGPVPRPRQPSNNSSLFVPREFSGRPGDRPQSFAPADPSSLVPPTPAFHSDGGGRPKSMAM